MMEQSAVPVTLSAAKGLRTPRCFASLSMTRLVFSILHLPSSIFLFLCVLCASAVTSRADDGWSLTTAD